MKMVLYTVQLSSHVQGKSQKEAIMKIRQMYWTALKMSWRVWIVFQYINLNYVPRQVTTTCLVPNPNSFIDSMATY